MKFINTTKLSSTQQKNLLLEMIRTDFKLRYKESALGYLWSVLKPLFLFAILYVVFTKFLKIGSDVPNYPLSLLLGIVLWNFFTEATGSALKSVISKGSLIRKIDIPRYLLPLPSIASAIINMFLNLLVVFVFLIFAENTAFGWQTLVFFPLILLELVILSTGVGYFLAALYVRFRDVSYIWDIIKQALWYSMPLIYPLSRVPSVELQKLIILNPLSQIIQDARAVLTYSGTIQIGDLFSNPLVHLLPIILVIIIFIGSVAFYNKKSDTFAEQV